MAEGCLHFLENLIRIHYSLKLREENALSQGAEENIWA
jgi:hypothetical protein